MEDENEEMFLTSENVEELSTCELIAYSLPHRPNVKVYVKQTTVADMKRIQNQLQKKGEVVELAQTELIVKSIVNPDGSPIYTPDKVKLLKTGNTPLYMSLLTVIGKANKRTEDQDEEEIETFTKN